MLPSVRVCLCKREDGGKARDVQRVGPLWEIFQTLGRRELGFGKG
jgi:hypothetical protein